MKINKIMELIDKSAIVEETKKRIEQIEHGRYYYCIKDYYSGGCKRASKGEVVQALRGMSMMALGVKANEYFIPVKCIIDNKFAWSEEDEMIALSIEQVMNCVSLLNIVPEKIDKIRAWLKSLRPQNTWKPSDKQIKALNAINGLGELSYVGQRQELINLYNDLKKLKGE